MTSSHSANDLEAVRARLESGQLEMYRFLNLKIPDQSELSPQEGAEYLRTNPDVNSKADHSASEARYAAPQDNVIDLTSPPSPSILRHRVADLKTVCTALGYGDRLAKICFGTLPGGGLDAHCFKEGDAYGVVIPEGFFHLTNLMTKIVILLQPISATAEGPVFLPTASFGQLSLANHPYVVFRQRDLVEAFFLAGDPMAALPYHHAIPYQDRFAYLLVGTELFVLAHEVAHILLGHLDDKSEQTGPDKELAADRLAFSMVTEFFRQGTDFAPMRANACGLLFLSTLKLWETTLERVTGDPQIAKSHTHPVFDARLRRFFDTVDEASPKGDKVPGWYIFTHNAIRMLIEVMADDAIAFVKAKAGGIEGMNARVLPPSHMHLGKIGIDRELPWRNKIATLIGSADPADRRIGLWFLHEYPPYAAGLYAGLLGSSDESTRALCKEALIAIEPMYVSYLPRLLEKFHEMQASSKGDQYLMQLCSYLCAMAGAELGEASRQGGPMSAEFFQASPGSESPA